MAEQIPNIVLVEDNDFDVKRVERGFARLGQDRRILRARDGVEALRIVRGEDEENLPQKPFVVMLDLNMPRMGGLEFLDEIRSDSQLRETPVFVVTTSDFHRDIRNAHARMISGYIIKPDTAAEMITVLQALDSFWTKCVFPE